MSIYLKLNTIQTELKAPKGQYNSYGKYKYRSCEDIQEALKPILKDVGATLILSDSLEVIGDRYYIKATATLVDLETGESIVTTAYAREEESKKGMDGSQVTGASSSYARKYALNGMFIIDDTKDSDSTNTHGKDERTSEKIDNIKATVIANKLKEKGISLETILKTYSIKNLGDMTLAQFDNCMKRLANTK